MRVCRIMKMSECENEQMPESEIATFYTYKLVNLLSNDFIKLWKYKISTWWFIIFVKLWKFEFAKLWWCDGETPLNCEYVNCEL